MAEKGFISNNDEENKFLKSDCSPCLSPSERSNLKNEIICLNSDSKIKTELHKQSDDTAGNGIAINIKEVAPDVTGAGANNVEKKLCDIDEDLSSISDVSKGCLKEDTVGKNRTCNCIDKVVLDEKLENIEQGIKEDCANEIISNETTSAAAIATIGTADSDNVRNTNELVAAIGNSCALEIEAASARQENHQQQHEECGSLFSRCDSCSSGCLVKTFCDSRNFVTSDNTSYSGPVSLTEILQEREQHYLDWRCSKFSFDDTSRGKYLDVWSRITDPTQKKSIDKYLNCSDRKILRDGTIGIRFNTLTDSRNFEDLSRLEDTTSRMCKEAQYFYSMGNGASTGTPKPIKPYESNGYGFCASTIVDNCARGPPGLVVDSCARTSGIMVNCANEAVIPLLQGELKEWELKAMELNSEVVVLRRELEGKEEEILKLQREVHKLRSVLQQTTPFSPDGDLLSSLQQVHGMVGQNASNKKQGVSAESSRSNQTATDIQVQHFEKDFRSKQLIKAAIMENDFLKNLDLSQVRELVESMYQQECTKGSYVIREGESGAHLYVAAEGEFEVIKENKVLGHMGPGKVFGELAILYNCTRTASVRVVKDSKVWVLDRRVFQRIMKRTGLQRLEENINFLRSVPLLHNLSNDILARIADCLEVEFFPAGHHIIREGASGDTFFILSGGSVKVTQRIPGTNEEQDLRILERGDYFGEQALLKEEFRTASVIALSPGVECLTLDRESFIHLIGDLSELHHKDYGDRQRSTLSRPSSSSSMHTEGDQDLEYLSLNDLDIVATLGIGGFGRVELVQCIYDKSQTYALKCLKKRHIVETHQQEHVYSEKNIMIECRSPFICRLYKTFKDSKYVYMLLEACLGGEVWTILRDRGCFDDATACFITACVVEALDYLHSRGIVYRDLKPENLLLDSQGYVKIVDFGFAKRLGYSSKTWTFCGTPEYVAPEIILNKGHDRAVDCWSLGILMHELLTGAPPFSGSDPMKVYNMILKGINMVVFPRHITRSAQCLIKRLCRDTPAERLGCQKGGIADIRKNKWFQGFDWDGLRMRTMVPPILPQVHSSTDTSNFDNYPKDADVPSDEDSNWDIDF